VDVMCVFVTDEVNRYTQEYGAIPEIKCKKNYKYILKIRYN